MNRFPELSPATMTPEQLRVYNEIISGQRGSFSGPFNALLRSPEICDHAQKLGAFIRYEGTLPGKLRELAILVTARRWRAQYEWYVHSRIALDEGLDQTIVNAIAETRAPSFAEPDEEVVYQFCHTMLQSGEVSDADYVATCELLGEAGVIELIGLMGFYCLISFTLNTAQVQVPEGFKLLT